MADREGILIKMPKNKAKGAVVRVKAQNPDLENRVNRALEEKGYSLPSDKIDEEPFILDLTQLNGQQYRLILREIKKLPKEMTERQMDGELQNVKLVLGMIHRTKSEDYSSLFPYARKLRVFNDELIVLREYIERGKNHKEDNKEDVDILMSSDLITSLYPKKEDIESIIEKYPLTVHLGDKKRGNLFSDLMKKLYDINFIERLDWRDYVREELAEGKIARGKLRKIGEQKAFYMLSFLSYLTRDAETLDIIPREEVRISSPSIYPKYKISLVMPDRGRISLFMKIFEKDKDDEAFLKEDEANWFYSQFFPEKEKHLVASSDDYFHYIIRGFINGKDTLDELEEIEELRRNNKINEYKYKRRKYTLIKERVSITAKSHSLPLQYLAQPSLTPFEMLEKREERFISPLKEQKILTKKSLEKNMLLGHLFIAYEVLKRPTITSSDNILANLVDGVPIDHERVKEVTHKNDLDAALRFGDFLSDERNITLEKALKLRGIKFNNSEFKELGFNHYKLKENNKISEQELFHRLYFGEYNRQVDITRRHLLDRTTDMLKYIKELFISSTIVPQEQKNIIIELIDSMPKNKRRIIRDIFPTIAKKVLEYSSPELIKQAHWIQRALSYFHFINCPKDKKEEELDFITDNELLLNPIHSSAAFHELERYLEQVSKAEFPKKLESYREFDKDSSGVQRTFELYGQMFKFMRNAEDNVTKIRELKYMQSLFINGLTCLEQFNRRLTSKEKEQTLGQIIEELKLNEPQLEALEINRRDYSRKVGNLVESYIASLSALKPKLIKYVQNIETKLQT